MKTFAALMAAAGSVAGLMMTGVGNDEPSRLMDSPAAWQPSGVPATQPGTTPQPSHTKPQPGQTTPPSPDQPANPESQAPGNDGMQPMILDPNDPRLLVAEREALVRLRAARPFTLQSPQAEAILYNDVQRLVRDEQRLTQSGDEHLRRLGEIRGMSGERQTTAVLDLLQQVLMHNRELQQYLVRSRTAWTGDLPPAREAREAREGREAREAREARESREPVRPNSDR